MVLLPDLLLNCGCAFNLFPFIDNKSWGALDSAISNVSHREIWLHLITNPGIMLSRVSDGQMIEWIIARKVHVKSLVVDFERHNDTCLQINNMKLESFSGVGISLIPPRRKTTRDERKPFDTYSVEDVVGFLNGCANLSSLNFIGTEGLSDDILLNLDTSVLAKLRTLCNKCSHFSGTSNTRKVLLHLSKHCVAIEKFIFSINCCGYGYEDHEQTMTILNNLNANMTTLGLHCIQFNAQSLKLVSDKFKKLRELCIASSTSSYTSEIEMNSDITLNTFITIISKCTQLTFFNIQTSMKIVVDAGYRKEKNKYFEYVVTNDTENQQLKQKHVHIKLYPLYNLNEFIVSLGGVHSLKLDNSIAINIGQYNIPDNYIKFQPLLSTVATSLHTINIETEYYCWSNMLDILYSARNVRNLSLKIYTDQGQFLEPEMFNFIFQKHCSVETAMIAIRNLDISCIFKLIDNNSNMKKLDITGCYYKEKETFERMEMYLHDEALCIRNIEFVNPETKKRLEAEEMSRLFGRRG